MPASAIESVDVLTDDDAARYAQIFLLQDKEKIETCSCGCECEECNCDENCECGCECEECECNECCDCEECSCEDCEC